MELQWTCSDIEAVKWNVNADGFITNGRVSSLDQVDLDASNRPRTILVITPAAAIQCTAASTLGVNTWCIQRRLPTQECPHTSTMLNHHNPTNWHGTYLEKGCGDYQ
jgi:hypothetical protein